MSVTLRGDRIRPKAFDYYLGNLVVLRSAVVKSLLVRVILGLGLVGAVASAQPDDPDTENAKLHFRLGSELYTANHYADALLEFKKALRMKPLPAFRYNIARCYDRLERYPEAIVEYEAYLAAGAAQMDVGEVQARIAELRSRVAEEKQSVAAPLAPSASPTAPTAHSDQSLSLVPTVEKRAESSQRRRWVWPVVGVGAAVVIAAIVTGIVVAVSAKDYAHDAHQFCTGRADCTVYPP